MGYKKTFIKSLSWMSILQFLTRIVSMVKIAIIARILTPADFGLFGIALLVIGISEIFSEFGFQYFLIQYKRNIKEYANSVWVTQIIRGFVLFVILLLVSYPVSIFFKSPFLIFILFLGAFNPIIKAFENVYIITYQKELIFKKEFIYRFLIVIIDFFVSVSVSIITHSVLALVFGIIISSLGGTVYSWLVIKEKPKFEFDKLKITKIIHYGKWMNLNSIFYYITTQLDSLVIGKLYGVTGLGFYQVSQKFSYTPMQEIADIFGKVSFPLYSKISSKINRLKIAYFKMLIGQSLVELLIFIVLYTFSKEAILILLGPKWGSTQEIFKIFLIYGFIASILGTNGSLFMSIGRQDVLTKVSLLRLIVLIPTILVLVSKLGAIGAVYAYIISLLIASPFYLLSVYLLFKGKIKPGFTR